MIPSANIQQNTHTHAQPLCMCVCVCVCVCVCASVCVCVCMCVCVRACVYGMCVTKQWVVYRIVGLKNAATNVELSVCNTRQ